MTRNLIIFLRVIHSKMGVDRLENEGLLYHQIADLIAEAERENLIVMNEDDIFSLTPQGIKTLMCPANQRKLDGGWIEPLDKERRPSIDKFAAFVPDKDAIADLAKT